MAVPGSACGPVIVPVFKTGGRQVFLSPVGSTPTRFRHFKPAWLLKGAGKVWICPHCGGGQKLADPASVIGECGACRVGEVECEDCTEFFRSHGLHGDSCFALVALEEVIIIIVPKGHPFGIRSTGRRGLYLRCCVILYVRECLRVWGLDKIGARVTFKHTFGALHVGMKVSYLILSVMDDCWNVSRESLPTSRLDVTNQANFLEGRFWIVSELSTN